MGAATIPSADSPRLLRFDRAERAVHWTTAAVFTVLIATGAVLYLGPLSAIVGRRPLVRMIHVYCGLALPVPFLAGVVGRWGAALRRDLGELNRWTADDVRWFRSRGLALNLNTGKFNAGQKFNAVFLAAGGVVMLMTGSIMKWFDPFPTSWRTGATFVHDWTALGLGIAVAGHVWFALNDRDALAGMWRGSVPVEWARRRRPAWFDAVSRRETSGSG